MYSRFHNHIKEVQSAWFIGTGNECYDPVKEENSMRGLFSASIWESGRVSKCPSCPLSFDRTQHLKDHMENIHQSVPTFSIEGKKNFSPCIF